MFRQAHFRVEGRFEDLFTFLQNELGIYSMFSAMRIGVNSVGQ
jgi:hypothetical protein